MNIRLDGRTALVTGGSKGIGFAIARTFAGSGADVAIVARRPEVLEQAKAEIDGLGGGHAHAIAADVATADGVASAYASAMQAFGRIDILVNNAGVSCTGPFESISDEIWQADLDLKLFAAIRTARLVLPQMKERRWGRIINVLNLGAKAPRAGSAPTSVSRAAGLALTKVLAGEGASHNVLVNALLVGLIDSDQWVRRHASQSPDEAYEAFTARLASGVPLGRIGQAQEFANIACFLASDAAGYITGTAINVDGGTSPVV